jgi:hypothetical protein
MNFECSHCETFPYPTRVFKELSEHIERHAELWQCESCGTLLEMITEERGHRALGIEEARLIYRGLQLPVTVPFLRCKHCAHRIDLSSAIAAAPFAWPQVNAFWYVCPSCSTGNHLRVQNALASVIEIVGCPGPEWATLECARMEGLSVEKNAHFLEVWLDKVHRAIPARV